MKFHEINLILSGYEFYRYERKSKKTLQSLESSTRKSSISNDGKLVTKELSKL